MKTARTKSIQSLRQKVRATRAAVSRAADRCDAMDELAKQLLRYDITDLDVPQADSERQFLADTVNNVLRWRLGAERLEALAALIQAAHQAAEVSR